MVYSIRNRGVAFLNWKLCIAGFLGGCSASYKETVLDIYSRFSDSRHNSLNPVKIDFDAKQVSIYERLSRQGAPWIKLRSWENLDRMVIPKETAKSPSTFRGDPEPSTLTNSTLARPGGIIIEPTIFHNPVEKCTVTIVHVGDKLCGYPFLVHGGILATLLNETFKRNVSLAGEGLKLKDDFMVTTLSISYKAPALANQFLVIKTTAVPSDRDGFLSAISTIETTNGRILVKGKANLVETGRASKLLIESESSKWLIF